MQDSDVVAFAAEINATETMTELALSGTWLSSGGCVRLARAIAPNSRIVGLDLSCATALVNDDAPRALVALIDALPSLTRLDVASVSLGDAGVDAIARAAEPHHRLVSLNVAANGLERCAFLSRLPWLRSLAINHNTLQRDAVEAIVQLSLTSLTSLSFVACGGEPNWATFNRLLASTTLTSLTTSCWTADDQHDMPALERNGLLRVLTVFDFSRDEDGGGLLRAFSDVLRRNRRLQRLVLPLTVFGPAMDEFLAALEANPTLVHFSCQDFDPPALVELLERNRRIPRPAAIADIAIPLADARISPLELCLIFDELGELNPLTSEAARYRVCQIIRDALEAKSRVQTVR